MKAQIANENSHATGTESRCDVVSEISTSHKQSIFNSARTMLSLPFGISDGSGSASFDFQLQTTCHDKCSVTARYSLRALWGSSSITFLYWKRLVSPPSIWLPKDHQKLTVDMSLLDNAVKIVDYMIDHALQVPSEDIDILQRGRGSIPALLAYSANGGAEALR